MWCWCRSWQFVVRATRPGIRMKRWRGKMRCEVVVKPSVLSFLMQACLFAWSANFHTMPGRWVWRAECQSSSLCDRTTARGRRASAGYGSVEEGGYEVCRCRLDVVVGNYTEQQLTNIPYESDKDHGPRAIGFILPMVHRQVLRSPRDNSSTIDWYVDTLHH